MGDSIREKVVGVWMKGSAKKGNIGRKERKVGAEKGKEGKER